MSNFERFRVLIAESDPVMAKIILNQVACSGYPAEDINEQGTKPPGAKGGCLDFVMVHWAIASADDFSFLRNLENSSTPIPYIVMLRDKDGPAEKFQEQLEDRGSRFILSQPFSTDKLEEALHDVVAALPEALRDDYRRCMGNGHLTTPFDMGAASLPGTADLPGAGPHNQASNSGDMSPDTPEIQVRSSLFDLAEADGASVNGSAANGSLTEEEQAVVSWFDDPEFLGSTQRLRESIQFRLSFDETNNGVSVEKVAEPPAPYGEQAAPVASSAPPQPLQESPRDQAAETAKESSAMTARLHFSRGKEALAARDYTQAIRNFTAVLQLKPGSPQAYKGLAVAFRGKGDWNRSCYFLGRACQSFIWCGKFEEGLAMHEEMKKRGITTVHPFGAVAQTLVKRGRLDKALRLLEQGRKLAPKDADMLWAYALLLSFKGDKQSAVRALDELLASAAKHKDAKNLRAKLLSKPPKPKNGNGGNDPESPLDAGPLSDEES
jgi:tetratricopeptide (TPR) repeat protein/CheY-like chemotaxis protein